MRSLALRLGPPGAGGYPLGCWVGEESDVVERLRTGAEPDIDGGVVPLDLSPAAPPPATPALDVREARTHFLAADGTDDTANVVGALLFGVLDRPAVRQLWRAERDAARIRHATSRSTELRTLLDIQPHELRALPWETMRDGAQMLHCQPWATIARWLPGAGVASPVLPWPLRLLVVVGADPSDKRIHWLEELHGILATVCPRRHWIDLELFECRVPRTDGVKVELRRAIEAFRPHVVHFIGHGRAAVGASPAALELWDAARSTAEEWTAQDIVNWFGAHPPRLAMLNACRTSKAGGAADAIIALQAAGAAFYDAGAAAVVGMQGDVPGRAAASFAAAFYEAIARREGLDVAAARGRLRILDERGFSERDSAWALPTVSVSVPLSEVLTMAPDIDRDRILDVSAHREIAALRSFIDRRGERRVLREGHEGATQQPGDLPRSRNLMFVLGASELGKTSMLKCCLEWFLLREHQVIYVDFAQRGATDRAEPLDAIDSLRHVRGRHDVQDDLLRPQVYRHFAPFNDLINALLEKRLPNPRQATGVDDGRRYVPGSAHPDTMELAFESFLACLAETSRQRPLVIALDHIAKRGLGIVADDARKEIVPRLLTPIHRGALPNVTVLLAAAEEELPSLGLEGLRRTSIACSLDLFPPLSWDVLAREYAMMEQLNDAVAHRLIDRIGPESKAWGPKWLAALRLVYDATVDTARG